MFEIPTLPPSVPGMRMFDALRAALTAAAGVRLDPAVLARDRGPVIAERMRAARIEAIRSLNQA